MTGAKKHHAKATTRKFVQQLRQRKKQDEEIRNFQEKYNSIVEVLEYILSLNFILFYFFEVVVAAVAAAAQNRLLSQLCQSSSFVCMGSASQSRLPRCPFHIDSPISSFISILFRLRVWVHEVFSLTHTLFPFDMIR